MTIQFMAGEVHALLGENGAGKSTLIKTVAGALTPDAGEIHIGHTIYRALNPAAARKFGIEVIYQEFNLVPTLSVAENICLGEHKGWRVNRPEMRAKAASLLSDLQANVHPDALVRDLSSSQQQLVEIAKALAKNPKILIMDEPTAPLSVQEVQSLFQVIRRLRDTGTAIVYVTHRMDEIFDLADCVSVLRDGRWIQTLRCSETNRSSLIRLMVGRELNEQYPVRVPPSSELAMELHQVSGNGVKEISFELRSGEILGVSGLVGAGRTELARLILGAGKLESGEIRIRGAIAKLRSPRQAIAKGICLIPENRKEEGCFLEQPIRWNVSIAALRYLRRWLRINRQSEYDLAASYSKKLQIKTPHLEQKVKNLSGGNQQKVVIAKTLAAQSTVLLFDEPTRGIDVGARHEIYKLMVDLASQGMAILMITSDMEELLGMSDRVMVLHTGRMAGMLDRKDCTQERILSLASGTTDQNPIPT
ncbi:sugar ABC transporter ATP-binding protein [Rhodoferax mekongensis]|uniref:sugar ABC transporter ATP-binding protein n=1 Tax=Rhodoferax mekongensis TaxID=3068341 RepID=UPI0028BD3FEC|nr:sugar ABC transporter ATP-binding protein [Rhodoferax sp. TBRC 17199]MDT7517090.1 sugar ABC transporter ATP-binding protein [Rhodoferax sp. TBRC 17199]